MGSVLFAVYLAVGLFLGLMIHEYAHALAAVRLGDPTPRLTGRLTLNPRPHVDRFGTIILPAILLLPVLFGRLIFPVFAYAKPQDRRFEAFGDQERREIAIALSGPAANLVLAVGFGTLLRLVTSGGELADFLAACLQVNVILAVLNLVPLPPLDGYRVVSNFLSGRAAEVYRSWEPYGALFILVIFFLLPGPIFAFVNAIGNGICSAASGFACL